MTFDSACHKVWIKKVSNFGIGGKLLKQFNDYLVGK